MKVLIMGCGRIGALVASALWREGHQVRVMDTAPQRFLALPPEMREQEGTTFLGDGTRASDLVAAGIEGMDAFLAVSDDDNRNGLAAQKAKYIFKVPQVVCLVQDPARTDIYRAHGIVTVSPTKVVVGLVREALIPDRSPSRRSPTS
ncbi:MAG: NAD-binding protein [Dehalococcoidia bacterium]|nr:NAD-binding protein [Dehalococcoidia bacterium]MDW8120500.1 NAD-binding protein [Chloroflexota bacterium]